MLFVEIQIFLAFVVKEKSIKNSVWKVFYSRYIKRSPINWKQLKMRNSPVIEKERESRWLLPGKKNSLMLRTCVNFTLNFRITDQYSIIFTKGLHSMLMISFMLCKATGKKSLFQVTSVVPRVTQNWRLFKCGYGEKPI